MKKLFLLLTAVLMTVVCALAQAKTVSGTVVYAGDNEPLPGATVLPVGGGQGTATDIDGRFTISLPANVTKVTVSYVGMHSQTVTAHDGMVVKLNNSDNNLDEVMVVAYGTAKKSAYTGSASVVKSDAIEGRMVTNAANALAGNMAGVQVINTTGGQPGTSPRIRVRGVGTIYGDANPLYVVDGMPFDGDIATLNTMDVESMTVLKDAAAAALYGARGANGVVLITTKRGKAGEAKITLDTRWGSNSRQIKGYDVITDPAMYYEMAYGALYAGYNQNMKYDAVSANLAANQALTGTATTPGVFGAGYQIFDVPAGQLLIGQNGKLNPNARLGRSNGLNYFTPDNWYDETFSHGLRQEYNLSITGGTDRFNFYGSVGYLDDSGIIEGSGYARLSSRIGAEYQAKKWLKIGASVAYNHVKMNSPSGQDDGDNKSSGNAFYVVSHIAPIYPMYVRNADGSLMMDNASGHPVYDYGDGKYARNAVRNYMSGANPASNFIYDTDQLLMDVLDAKWYATITPIENLSVTGTVGYFLDNTRGHTIMNKFYGSVATSGGVAQQTFSRLRGLNLQALANYRRTFFDIHHADFMLGYESYDRNSENLSGYGYGLYLPNGWAVNNTLNNANRKTSGGSTGYTTRGIFGRINYDYDSRYFASVSYRRDASSNFHPDHRWGDFFSFSLGWDAAKERFMEDYTWIDLLKVKASYGQQGNDNLGITGPYYADKYTIQGSETWADGNLAQKGNPDITWETSHAWNVGVDFSFLESRVSGTVEYFLRQTSDMLYLKPVSPSNGYPSIPMNIGSMRNSGLEFELNVRPVVTRDIKWEINLNGTWLKNKVLKLHPQVNGEIISGMRIIKEGGSVYNFYLVEYAGVDPKTGEPLYWALDENGNEYRTNNYELAAAGVENSDDPSKSIPSNKKDLGSALPKFYGGFGTTFSFHGFDVSAQFSYQLGGKIYDQNYMDMMHSGMTGSMGTNWHQDALNAWTPSNTNTNIPQLNYMASRNFSDTESTFGVVSSNYLSLNNVTIGYTIPSKLVRKLGIESLRVYGAADNVALWTKRKGLDPRMTFYGSTGAAPIYSLIRNFSGGLKVVF